jgi:hypothetical protein
MYSKIPRTCQTTNAVKDNTTNTTTLALLRCSRTRNFSALTYSKQTAPLLSNPPHSYVSIIAVRTTAWANSASAAFAASTAAVPPLRSNSATRARVARIAARCCTDYNPFTALSFFNDHKNRHESRTHVRIVLSILRSYRLRHLLFSHDPQFRCTATVPFFRNRPNAPLLARTRFRPPPPASTLPLSPATHHHHRHHHHLPRRPPPLARSPSTSSRDPVPCAHWFVAAPLSTSRSSRKARPAVPPRLHLVVRKTLHRTPSLCTLLRSLIRSARPSTTQISYFSTSPPRFPSSKAGTVAPAPPETPPRPHRIRPPLARLAAASPPPHAKSSDVVLHATTR